MIKCLDELLRYWVIELSIFYGIDLVLWVLDLLRMFLFLRLVVGLRFVWFCLFFGGLWWCFVVWVCGIVSFILFLVFGFCCGWLGIVGLGFCFVFLFLFEKLG